MNVFKEAEKFTKLLVDADRQYRETQLRRDEAFRTFRALQAQMVTAINDGALTVEGQAPPDAAPELRDLRERVEAAEKAATGDTWDRILDDQRTRQRALENEMSAFYREHFDTFEAAMRKRAENIAERVQKVVAEADALNGEWNAMAAALLELEKLADVMGTIGRLDSIPPFPLKIAGDPDALPYPRVLLDRADPDKQVTVSVPTA